MLILGEINKILKDCGFNGRIIGKTPYLNKHRGQEIQTWIDEHKERFAIDSFIILDDDADMDHLLPFLIKTSCDTGLQDYHVDAAITVLNSTQAMHREASQKILNSAKTV